MSIVIPTKNKLSRLRICLTNLFEIGKNYSGSLEIIVVNDGCTDETSSFLCNAKERAPMLFKVISNKISLGRSATRNLGAVEATGEVLLFVDDDILFSSELLQAHWELHMLSRDPIICRATILNLPWLAIFPDPQVCPPNLPQQALERHRITDEQGVLLMDKIHSEASCTQFEKNIHRLLNTNLEKCRWLGVTGGNLSINRNFFLNTLGGFDESFGVNWGLEDLELGFRAEIAGAKIEHISSPSVYHLDHQNPEKRREHKIALEYFKAKHGKTLGDRLSAYFDGQIDVLEVC